MSGQISCTILYICPYKMMRQKDGVVLKMMKNKMYPVWLTKSKVLDNKFSHNSSKNQKRILVKSVLQHIDENFQNSWNLQSMSPTLPLHTLKIFKTNTFEYQKGAVRLVRCSIVYMKCLCLT